MIALVWGCGGRKEEREKAKRCFQCPLHPPHLLLHLHPPLLSPSSRIGLLGRGGCVIVFPANVCKSASAGCKGNVCTVWLMYCNMRDDSSVAVRVPRKKKKKKKKPFTEEEEVEEEEEESDLVALRLSCVGSECYSSSRPLDLLSAPLCSSLLLLQDEGRSRDDAGRAIVVVVAAACRVLSAGCLAPDSPCGALYDRCIYIYLFIYLFHQMWLSEPSSSNLNCYL